MNIVGDLVTVTSDELARRDQARAGRTRPVFRMTADERRQYLARFVNMRVRVTVSWTRNLNSDRAYVGRLVAVARPSMGTTADLLILVDDQGDATAYSAAQVLSVSLVG